MITSVLLGHLTPVNKTILHFLADDGNIQVQHLVMESLEELRTMADSVDVLFVDLQSSNRNPLELIRYLKTFDSAKAIITINSMPSWRLAELVIDAGASGYLTQDTSEAEIIKAAFSTTQGEPFVRI